MPKQMPSDDHAEEGKRKYSHSQSDDQSENRSFLTVSRKRLMLRGIGILGLVIALPFFLWFILGALGVIPSLVEVFGIVGLRTPAAFTIAGLLMAAIGFYDK